MASCARVRTAASARVSCSTLRREYRHLVRSCAKDAVFLHLSSNFHPAVAVATKGAPR
jgi:gluconate kinase